MCNCVCIKEPAAGGDMAKSGGRRLRCAGIEVIKKARVNVDALVEKLVQGEWLRS